MNEQDNTYSIRQLLVDTLNKHYLLGIGGKGGRTYEFPKGMGLDDYVMRVRDIADPEMLWRFFEHTSSLTPARQLVRGINIGQPIFGARYGNSLVTLHVRQHGIPLSDLYQLPSPEIARGTSFRSYSKLLEQIKLLDQPGQNPFVPLMENIYLLSHSGYVPDLALPNILLDKEHGTLGLVDQLHQYIGAPQKAITLDHYAEALKFSLKTPYMLLHEAADTDEKRIAVDRLSAIGDSIDAAKRQVLEKHTLYSHLPKTLTFAKVNDTYAINVESHWRELPKQLAALRGEAAIPVR